MPPHAMASKPLRNWIRTLILFTYTDYKTIVLPVSVFACVSAPVHSFVRFLHAVLWIWLHLLQCNVSNQYRSVLEDAVNRPWRPLPSRLISVEHACILRWLLVPLCIGTSLCYGWDVALASACLTLTTVCYDELGLAGHFLGKNLCNVPGYVSFEIGATKIMGSTTNLDFIALESILCSAMVIFTTIQTQDFPDVAGDRALGRVTLPILCPEGSRHFTTCVLLFWSGFLSYAWSIGLLSSAVLISLGIWVAYRYYRFRKVEEDKKSYLIYNIWLLFVHSLAAHARWNLMAL
ncbi:hypothetical protein AcW1_005399 [Taiwanofungus camphoratus]|nr:hypothetical protein AcV7_009288 [Antrodia cinnamomea]KAI0956806.1 hypothetical protein AcW1_005399 [Antrodia cinnamomea]